MLLQRILEGIQIMNYISDAALNSYYADTFISAYGYDPLDPTDDDIPDWEDDYDE